MFIPLRLTGLYRHKVKKVRNNIQTCNTRERGMQGRTSAVREKEEERETEKEVQGVRNVLIRRCVCERRRQGHLVKEDDKPVGDSPAAVAPLARLSASIVAIPQFPMNPIRCDSAVQNS